jgi:ABC-type hemin transport system ATPase subunit
MKNADMKELSRAGERERVQLLRTLADLPEDP